MTLYKYLRPERLDVIEKCELRFTQPGALNDPFELRPRYESLLNEARVLANLSATPIDLEPILRRAYGMLTEEQRARMPFELAAKFVTSFMATDAVRSAAASGLLAALQLMRKGARLLCEQAYDALNRNVGILSLSEVPDDLLMWAHYADNHSGLVLGFDEKHPFFHRRRSPNDDFYFLRQVIYTAPPTVPAEFGDDAFLVTKGNQWSYEREWRMLAPLNDATRVLRVGEDTVYLYAFPPDALTVIVVGARASPALQGSARHLMRMNPGLSHVRFSQAALDLDNERVRIV